VATRNYLRAVTDNMGEGLFALDAQGAVTYMNDKAEQLLGWTQEQLLGQVMHGITHTRRHDGSEFPVEDCPILLSRRDGTRVRVSDDLFIRRDGSELPVAYTAAPFETEDGIEGCVVVFEDVSERNAAEAALQRDAEKLLWIERIQDAIAQDRFALYAQPIVDLSTGKIVQHELLLRMVDPDGTIVAPGGFLPVAEEYGLIGEIDRWVIGRAVALAAAGRPVEVNLSGHSVGDQEVLDLIERELEWTGADPALLVFEVTETALVENQAAAAVFAGHLRALGCKLALDDFGTGYGGFTYLKALPIDLLKIDIEFVRDLAVNPASRHVVEAVVALARGFELETVAEGVEDAETLALLRELGVDFAQGYHIARPAPAERMLDAIPIPEPRSPKQKERA
jgi:PAS domain S-box-containing protein